MKTPDDITAAQLIQHLNEEKQEMLLHIGKMRLEIRKCKKSIKKHLEGIEEIEDEIFNIEANAEYQFEENEVKSDD